MEMLRLTWRPGAESVGLAVADTALADALRVGAPVGVLEAAEPAAAPPGPPPLLPQLAWRCPGMERVMGIEPTLAAWEAAVLPLNYTRIAT